MCQQISNWAESEVRGECFDRPKLTMSVTTMSVTNGHGQHNHDQETFNEHENYFDGLYRLTDIPWEKKPWMLEIPCQETLKIIVTISITSHISFIYSLLSSKSFKSDILPGQKVIRPSGNWCHNTIDLNVVVFADDEAVREFSWKFKLKRQLHRGVSTIIY